MYAIVEDIQARYGLEFPALAGCLEDGTPDIAAAARALEEADSEINLALQGRYAVPINPAPAVLRRVCVDIAVAALPRNFATEATVYERRGREARALLASLAKGEITLGPGANPAPAQNSAGSVAYIFPSSDFRHKLDEL